MDRKQVKHLIAARLRSARKDANLSQGQLAEKIGASASSVLRWENEKSQIPIDQLFQVSRALGLGVSYFLQDLSDAQRASAQVEGEWLPIKEQGDRSEMAVRLKDLVEQSPNCNIYIQPFPSSDSAPTSRRA
jgi:transcriptional regulator with XRE-family HTH domain